MVLKSDSPFIRQDGLPFVIAGPCSAESRQQMLDSVLPLKGVKGLSALRAGIWKPRTRPGSFEGIGREAIPWLIEAGQILSLPVSTEVAKPEHVEACLELGVDILWIGARTTVNPFYVQEIAEAIRGTNVKVLVKNPIHPEIGLWMGALERFENVGIKSLGAVHRGYFSLNAAPYRNEAGWELAIALKEQWPELPILCDPSHIAGKNSLVPEVAQIGLELGLDGLMVEVHHEPEKALSDPQQQLRPSQFLKLLDDLKMHRQLESDEATPFGIIEERKQIDLLDKELLYVLHQRMKHVAEIALEKEREGLALFQWKRWMQVLESRQQMAQELGLDPLQAEELFRIIHKQSLNKQVEKVRESNEKIEAANLFEKP
jgi:chorismate mutase